MITTAAVIISSIQVDEHRSQRRDYQIEAVVPTDS